ncbi:MAG: GNAT family N-acetyltransferase [Alphaproteobacteria bacterium]|jgi:RimJ/RimL family protein N-acetyltransferase|nr:GNAT family N-acetyltransferase [Alphaproteobacteria bacterium]
MTDPLITGHRLNALGQPVGLPLDDPAPKPHPPRTPMHGRYCRLEPLAPDHAADLYAAFQEDRTGTLWTYMPHGPFHSPEACVDWVATVACRDDPMFFAVLAEGEPLGVASYLRIDRLAHSIETGWITFAPRLQRTAAATEAHVLMMARAFDELGYRRYEWKCDALNAASQRAAGRLGFTYEGTFRQATHYKGRNRDTAWFSVIDSEWPALKTRFETWLDPANFDGDGRQRAPL